MRFTIETKRHYGSQKITRQGVQFRCTVYEQLDDTAEDERCMDEVIRAIKADINEMGYYTEFMPRKRQAQVGLMRGTSKHDEKLTPREAGLKARLSVAENMAKQYRERYENLVRKIRTGGTVEENDLRNTELSQIMRAV